MAFTLSHAVLAPLLHKLSMHFLPIAALAIGCMTPDLHRLFTPHSYPQFHQWSGIFSFSLWIGLGFCGVWYLLYRPVIYRLLGLNDDLHIRSIFECLSFILRCGVAVLVGIATHLIWDGLTHVDFRTFAFHDFLSQSVQIFHHSYPMHRVLQIGSSAIALPFLVWMSYVYFAQHRTEAVSKPTLYSGIAILLLSLLFGFLSLIDYLRYIPDTLWQQNLYYFTGRSINEFSQGFLSCWSLACVLFLFFNARHYLD